MGYKRGTKKLLRIIDIFIILIVVMDLWVYSVHMTKLIKLYILEMCSLMYINYTSIKLLKRKRETSKIFQLCFLFISVLAE